MPAGYLSRTPSRRVHRPASSASIIFTGIAIIRAGGLPRWLGWVGLIFGVLSATGLAGPIGVGLRILLSSITALVTDRKVERPLASGLPG